MEAAISDHAFRDFQGLMHQVAGIHLPSSKKTLVSGRLAKRLRLLGLPSYESYFKLITSAGEAAELQQAIDLLTTNETYFFREPQHFEFLAREILPALKRGQRFRAWSAASSSGEEAYSIAMVLMDKLGPDAPWEVLGSDINRQVLARAEGATYVNHRIGGIPADYLRRFCLRGTGRMAGKLRIDPALRRRVRFAPLNLNGDLASAGEFDLILLRNVMIYFDLPMKRRVVDALSRRIKPGGWLMIGHSETLSGVSDRLRAVRPTIYRKDARA